MKFRYILEQKDLYQVLKKTGYIKTVGKRAVLETGILSILFIGFLICFFVTKDFRNLFFAVISAVFGIVIWIVPEFLLQRKAKSEAESKTVFEGTLEDDFLSITCHGETLKFPLNQTCLYRNCGELLIFYTAEKKMAVFPLHCLENEKREPFLNAVREGFLPYSQ